MESLTQRAHQFQAASTILLYSCAAVFQPRQNGPCSFAISGATYTLSPCQMTLLRSSTRCATMALHSLDHDGPRLSQHAPTALSFYETVSGQTAL
jgi:hypothetical protein